MPGKKFYIGNYTLEAIAAPGHTPGQLCLWIAREGVMFTADHVLFDITPNIAMWPNMPDALGSYLDSLGKFKNFEVTLALPGHRETGDYYARIDALLAHHNHRIAETKQIVQSHPGLLAYEIAGLMTWKIKADTWDQFPLIQKWFAVGECLSHLDYLRQRGEIIRLTNGNVHRYLPASHPQKLS
ncbi:MAG: MBL fold metallo-hydrolase [Evtepia sp.]